MGIIVDIIIIAIVLLSVFLAYRKGMIKLAIGLCSFIIAIVLTFALYLPISNFIINSTAIDEMLENKIYEKSSEIMEKEENEATNQIIETAKNEMLPQTSRNLAINIVKGGVIIILFLGIRIALKFVTILADLIAKLPIIEQINKTGGIVYGILRGILFVYILLLLLNISDQINPYNIINESVNESFIGKTMYQNNILNTLF